VQSKAEANVQVEEGVVVFLFAFLYSFFCFASFIFVGLFNHFFHNIFVLRQVLDACGKFISCYFTCSVGRGKGVRILDWVGNWGILGTRVTMHD